MTDTGARVTPVRDIDGGAAADAGQQVREELRRADERLRAMVRAYQEKPSAIDDAVLLAIDRTVSAEAAITGTFRLLQARVYAEGSPMRAERDVWEAFCEQKDEFAAFYRSALTALESYREILEAYRAVKRRSAPPQPGDLKRIRRDKHVHVEERDACLEAFSDFQGKFSAMLAVLCPVVLP
ncbi:MAG: hypothetical protein ACLPKI_16530 [Streptosporangiaceae bacterium]